MTPPFGTFCICRCGNRGFIHAGEFTNVGVSLYNERGTLLLSLADGPERAIRRGDLSPEWSDMITKDYFQNLMDGYGTLAELKKHMEGFGYAMAGVQVHIGGNTRLELGALQRLFDEIVLGIDVTKKPHVEWE